jgi:hypothetical protein
MSEKLSFIFNSAQGLMLAANYLLDHMEDEGAKRNPTKYSFILTAAATLESMLNDGIVSWAHGKFPRDDYKRQASAFLSINLRGKLDVIGYLISSGSHITDNTSQTYQDLSNLIKLRNEVAHSKDFFTEVEYIKDDDGNEGYIFPDEVAKKFANSPLISSSEKYMEVYKSLERLYNVLNHEISHEEIDLFKAV